MPTPEHIVLGLFLPHGVLEWFDVVDGSMDGDNLRIVLEEKNNPPFTKPGTPVISKGFKDITITDFPIRGRRALLTFRRRYWQLAGHTELLKRDIPLTFPGTQLETEFAHFLKATSEHDAGVARLYRRVSLPPSQGI